MAQEENKILSEMKRTLADIKLKAENFKKMMVENNYDALVEGLKKNLSDEKIKQCEEFAQQSKRLVTNHFEKRRASAKTQKALKRSPRSKASIKKKDRLGA